MYIVEDVISQVEEWIKQKEFEMDLEEDTQEKFEIACRIHHVKQNLPYYFKGQLQKGAYFHFCKHCGEIEFCSYVPATKERLIQNQTCFHCDFWEEREKSFLSDDNKTFIVNGKTYSDGGATKGRDTQYNGFGGAVFNIRMLDGSREWITNNLWCGGNIPKKYRLTTMKDTAEFIK